MYTKRNIFILGETHECEEGVSFLKRYFESAKKYDRNMTVFWFSDDCNFSIHSHRLDCAYFAKKPLTFEMLDKAFYRCKSLGIFI